MKICFIVGAYPTMKCGVGDYTSVLAEELAKKGNEVHVITSKRADSSKSKNVIIHNIVEVWKLKAIPSIIKELKKIQPDVVNIQYPSDEYYRRCVSLLPPIIKDIIRCKVTITIHEYDYFNMKEKKSLRDKIRLYLNFYKLDKIITVEEKFIERIKADYSKADIVHIPISSNIPKSQASIDEINKIKSKFGLEGKRVLSYFGFAVPVKGIEYLLRCMPKLDEDIRLLFINELNPENEYHKTLLNLIEDLKIKDKVIITGFYDDAKDIADMLSASNICVLPFVNGLKTSNGSFLAAYNQNIRVITTSKSNEKDDNGIYYVKPEKEEELLEKIKFALDDKTEFERQALTWDSVTEEFLNVFK